MRTLVRGTGVRRRRKRARLEPARRARRGARPGPRRSLCGPFVAVAADEAAGDGIAPLPVQEVAPGLFVYQAPYELADAHNQGAVANVGFIVGRDAVAVFDTGNSLVAGRRLRAAVREKTALRSAS